MPYVDHLIGFMHTPAGVVMCIALVAVIAGLIYDCALQRRIDKLEDEISRYVEHRVDHDQYG